MSQISFVAKEILGKPNWQFTSSTLIWGTGIHGDIRLCQLIENNESCPKQHLVQYPLIFSGVSAGVDSLLLLHIRRLHAVALNGTPDP